MWDSDSFEAIDASGASERAPIGAAADVRPLPSLPKFKLRRDFSNAEEYAAYVRDHLQAGATVKCRQNYEEVKKGDIGRVVKVDADRLHDLNVLVEWQRRRNPYWMRFLHLELLAIQATPSSSLKMSEKAKIVKNGQHQVKSGRRRVPSGRGQQEDLAAGDDGLIEDWGRCVRSMGVSSREHWAYTLTDGTSSFWQSCGAAGKHWIRLEMQPDVLVHELKIQVDPADSTYMPSLIQVNAGHSLSDLRELTAVGLGPEDEVVVLLANVRTFYKYVEVAVKQCRNGGIDCKVHGLQVLDVTSIKFTLSSFRLWVNDAQRTTKAPPPSFWLATPRSPRRTLGSKLDSRPPLRQRRPSGTWPRSLCGVSMTRSSWGA